MNRQRKAAILLRAVLLSLLFTGCLLAPVGDNSPDGLHAQTPPQGQVLGSLTEAERVWLRDHPVITLGHDPGWPPIEFSNERGELSGMSGDYLRLVQERLGVKFSRRKPDLAEVYARQKWEIDVATAALTPH
jgi:ABC-type amino acid transport substrate-binding protein